LTGALLKYMPELLWLLFLAWFIAIVYTTVLVVWLATARIEPWFIRSGARATGVFTLTATLFFAGFSILSTLIPYVTVRGVTAHEQVGK
jgi:threonine/homoserine/homoserine lactone efflux protein